MSHYVTLFRIGNRDFQKLVDNPKDYSFFKESLPFLKTHEGIMFLLSKGQTVETVEMVREIFYPQTYLGEKIDYAKLDLTEIGEGFDLFNEPTYYLTTQKVGVISSHLTLTDINKLIALYNPDEMNNSGIYPAGAWNNEVGVDIWFNKQVLQKDFEQLRNFFNRAKSDGDYIIPAHK